MTRSKHAFTLVELLVVIGIIALLISILLPSLSRARQHAVLVADLSNMRQVGQALMLYANENKGYLPHGRVKDGDTFNWHYVVTEVLGQADPNNPRKRAKILYSTGITPQPCVEPYYWWPAWTWNAYDERASYVCNPRIMAQAHDIDTANGVNRPAVRRSFADVKDPGSKLLIWDGGLVSWNNMSVPFMSPWYLDGWRWFWGHQFCDPVPPANWWDASRLDQVIGLGENSANDLPTMRTQTNVDFGGGYASTDRQPFWNGMRFRHMDNTTGAFLYLDGHAEARKLGEVLAREVCVNFK